MSIFRRSLMAKQAEPVVVPTGQLWYDADEKVTLYTTTGVLSHEFSNGRGVITVSSSYYNRCPAYLRGTAVKRIYLPAAVTTITTDAFHGCSKLISVTLHEGITSIGDRAFWSCYMLKINRLPSTVTSIGVNCFHYCPMDYLVIPIATPPTLGSGAFWQTTCPLYVPAASLEAYKAAPVWSGYASRIFAIPS